MATVLERVVTIVRDQLALDGQTVEPATNFTEDLQADSLDLVELLMKLEEEFQIGGGISDEDAERITTVQAAVDYLKAHGAED